MAENAADPAPTRFDRFKTILRIAAVSLGMPLSFLFFWPFSVFLIGASLSGVMLFQIWKGLASLRWLHTQGTIMSSGVETRELTYIGSHLQRVRGTISEVKVLYSYSVEGRQYDGRVIQYGWSGSGSGNRDIQTAENFLRDGNLSVYYNPDKPEEAVLVTGPGWPVALGLPFGLLIITGAIKEYDWNPYRFYEMYPFFIARDILLLAVIAGLWYWRRRWIPKIIRPR